MNIYMINTGKNYMLYYNAPPVPKKEKERLPVKRADRKSTGLEHTGIVTKEIGISENLEGMTAEAFSALANDVKNGMRKAGEGMHTKTSAILKEAAYSGCAALNYSAELSEKDAKQCFSQIIRREKIRSGLIMTAAIAIYGASWIPPLTFIPTMILLGPVIGYQTAMLKTLRRGISNIAFMPNLDVSKLELVIAGQKGIRLENPDLIEYMLAKGL